MPDASQPVPARPRGALALRAHRRMGLAIADQAVTATPGIVAALFLLLVLVTQPRWN